MDLLAGGPRRADLAASRRFRPLLEALEDRRLMTITCAPETLSMLHDRPFNGPSVLAYVTDTAGTPTVQLQSAPAAGSFTMNADGSYLFTPPSHFIGQTQFTYLATDGSASAVGTVTLNVYDTAPTANGLTTGVPVNGTLAGVNVLSSANDPDGDALTVSITQPQHGSAWVNANGSIGYTPNANFQGSDTVNFQVSDGILSSATAQLVIYVNSSSTISCTPGSAAVLHDQTFNGTSVLSNVSYSGTGTLTAQLETPPSVGTLVLNTDGTYTYTPPGGYTGQTQFSYVATDGTGSATGTVTLNVYDTAPTAGNVNAAVPVNGSLSSINVLSSANDPDSDLLSVSIAQPQHGTAWVNADGSIGYRPTAGYTGGDTVSFQVSDGILSSAAAVLTLNVLSSYPPPPTANNASFTVVHDTTLQSANILSGDVSPTGNALTVTIMSQGASGQATVNADGTINYAPNAGYVGTDTVTYKVNDGIQNSNVATITIAVTDVAPTAQAAGPYTVLTGQPLVLTQLLTLANAADGGMLTVVIVNGPTNGQLTQLADGTYQYTSNAGYVGMDSITYKVSDGILSSNTVTLSLSVVNAPIAVNNAVFQVTQGLGLAIAPGDLLALDQTSGSGSLQLTAFTQPANGTITQDTDGNLHYTPNAGFTGNDTFKYTVSDGVNTAQATVLLQVQNPLAIIPLTNPLGLTYSTDHTRAAAFTVDNRIVIWNPANRQPITTLSPLAPADGRIAAISFVGGSRTYLAVVTVATQQGQTTSTVRILTLGRQIPPWTQGSATVTGTAVAVSSSPDGTRIAVATAAGDGSGRWSIFNVGPNASVNGTPVSIGATPRPILNVALQTATSMRLTTDDRVEFFTYPGTTGQFQSAFTLQLNATVRNQVRIVAADGLPNSVVAIAGNNRTIYFFHIDPITGLWTQFQTRQEPAAITALAVLNNAMVVGHADGSVILYVYRNGLGTGAAVSPVGVPVLNARRAITAVFITSLQPNGSATGAYVQFAATNDGAIGRYQDGRPNPNNDGTFLGLETLNRLIVPTPN